MRRIMKKIVLIHILIVLSVLCGCQEKEAKIEDRIPEKMEDVYLFRGEYSSYEIKNGWEPIEQLERKNYTIFVPYSLNKPSEKLITVYVNYTNEKTIDIKTSPIHEWSIQKGEVVDDHIDHYEVNEYYCEESRDEYNSSNGYVMVLEKKSDKYNNLEYYLNINDYRVKVGYYDFTGQEITEDTKNMLENIVETMRFRY